MPKMKKDEASRAALLHTGVTRSNGFVKLSGLTKEQSQAAAIQSRRAEFAKQPKDVKETK